MTPFFNMLLTVVVISGGAFAIVYALKLFPIVKHSGEQYELDLDAPKDYARRQSAMAHSVDRMTDTIREETRRLKAKPRLK